jgi:hypothetical protein
VRVLTDRDLLGLLDERQVDRISYRQLVGAA